MIEMNLFLKWILQGNLLKDLYGVTVTMMYVTRSGKIDHIAWNKQ